MLFSTRQAAKLWYCHKPFTMIASYSAACALSHGTNAAEYR